MHVYYAVTLRNNCSFGHRDQIPRVYPGSNSNTMVMKYIAEKKKKFSRVSAGSNHVKDFIIAS